MPVRTSQPAAPRLLLDVREAAAALSISARTLWSLTSPRGPIPVLKLGTRTLYPVDALRKWIADQAGNGAGGGRGGQRDT